MKKLALFSLLLVVACLPIFLGIFHSGFFLTDDGNWMIIRLSAFYEALRQGQFPVRFLPRLNSGYGYPVADFLYPLFLYVGSFIHAFHINFFNSLKVLFGISIISSTFGCFLWLRRRFGDLPAFAGSLVYTIFPYHLLDITKRGSIGEALALGILPFIFLCIDTENAVVGAIVIALLILSHNTLALFFLSLLCIYAFFEKKIRVTIITLVLGVGISAFFWAPAVFDIQYTVFSKTAVANFNQYFLSSDLYPYIGIITFFIFLFSVSLYRKKISTTVIFFLVVGLLSISLTNKVSLPLWQVSHLTNVVQFPFRILSITIPCVGFLAAYIVYKEKNRALIFTVIILVLLYISSWQFFFAKSYQMLPDAYYSTNESTSTIHDEYMPVWVKKPLPQRVAYSANGVSHVVSLIDKGDAMSFVLETSVPTKITIGKVFFPGWMLTIDTISQKIYPSSIGLIQFNFPKGKHSVKLWFGETPFRTLSDGISIISCIGLIGIYVLKKKGILHV